MRVIHHMKDNVVAYAALFVALGGVSWAATALPANSVGTPQLKANAVTTDKVKNGTLVAADFKSGQLKAGPAGAAGPAGPAGAAGPAGPAGAAGPSGALVVKAWAAVKGDGTVRRHFGVNLVVREQAGVYLVPTDIPDTSRCAAVASAGAFNNGVSSGQASANFSTTPDNKVRVATYSATGALNDSDFSLIIVCPAS